MKKSISQTPAPKKDRIYGSKVNAKGSAASEKSASEIKLSPTIIAALTTKLKEFRAKHSNENITLNDLKAVYRRGLGAYSTSHRPNIPRNAWAMARVNKFLLKAGGTKVKAAYVQDDDLMKYAHGGATIGKATEFYQRTYADGTTQKFTIDDYEKNVYPNLGKGGQVKSFFTWFYQWYKVVSDKMNIIISLPNEISAIPYQKNVVILDLFEKTDQNVQAKPYLKKIIDKADEYGVTIYLFPEARHKYIKDELHKKKITREYIIQYYKDFGFELMPEEQFMRRVPKYENGGEVGISIVQDVKDLEIDDKIKYISDKTRIDLKKSKNTNSWYGRINDKAIRISDHPSKFVERGKEQGTLAIDLDFEYFHPDAIIHLLNDTNPFEHYKKGDKIFHSSDKIGEVTYLSSDYKKGYVEVEIKEGRIVKYDMEKFLGNNYEDKSLKEQGGDLGQEITCRGCGWNWNTKDSEEFDKYVCHQCGFDNRMYYDTDPIGYKDGGQVNNCKEFILQKSVLTNGFYFNMQDLSKLFDPYGQMPTHLDFTLVSYNSDSQSNLDVIDTINPTKIVDKLSELLGLEKNQSYAVVHYVISKAKRLTNINQITTEKIVVVDRDMVVCENLNEYADGGEVDERKETYAKWKSLVNMSKGELEKFYNSQEGKDAGLSSSEAKEQGISSGRESARMIMKMKDTPKEEWTPTMWKWANKQISFISRMRGMKGELYDDNGNKTRKHTSLLIWGHNPKKDTSMKFADGGWIDNKMELYHGGNLDEYNDIIAQKSGRYEYGAGLYLTSHLETALKYAKGSRKLYKITITKGQDIHDATINFDKINTFIKKYVIASKRKEIVGRVEKYNLDGNIKAYIFNNIILNEKAISPSNTKYLRNFLIENGVDYEIVDNPYGWGETMVVLYNMDNIVNVEKLDRSKLYENGGIIFYQDFAPRERKFKIEEPIFYEADRLTQVEAKIIEKVDDKKVKIEILEDYIIKKNIQIGGRKKGDFASMVTTGLGKERFAFDEKNAVKRGKIKIVNQEKINPVDGYFPINYTPKSKEFIDFFNDNYEKKNGRWVKIGLMSNGGEIDYNEAIKQFRIAYPSYQEGYLTSKERRSIAMKSFYATKRLEKTMGFDIGHLPSLTDDQMRIRQEFFERLRKAKEENQMANGGVADVLMEDTVQRMDDPNFADISYYKNGGATDNSVINKILEEVKPYQDELTEKWIEAVNKEGKIILTDFDIEFYKFGLVVDLVKAIGNYIEQGDSIENINFSKNKGVITLSSTIIRDGNKYGFFTNVIYAGGYNIQRLHFRYLVDTKLPHKRINTYYDKLNEEYKKLTKIEKLKKDIAYSENSIKKFEIQLEKAKENSKLSDEDVEKVSRLDEKFKDSWKIADFTWEQVVKNGADANYNYDEKEFIKSKNDFKNGTIASWRTFNANVKDYEMRIAREKKEIQKLNKKIAELQTNQMADGGELLDLTQTELNFMNSKKNLYLHDINKPMVESNFYKKGGDLKYDSANVKQYFAHGSGNAGGVLVGKRHSEGGIKAVNKSTGQPLEMEGGEVVITRNAVSDDKKREFEGEMLTNKEILSRINESGGGVKIFSEGGDIESDTCSCSGKSYKYGGKMMVDYDIAKQIAHTDKQAYYRSLSNESYETGGVLDISNLNTTEMYVLDKLDNNVESKCTVHRNKLSDISNIQDLGMVYSTPKKGDSSCYEVRLTEYGKSVLNEIDIPDGHFAKGGQTADCGCGNSYANGGGVETDIEYKYFKGIDADYKNQFEINKAIEELILSIPSEQLTAEEKGFIGYFSGYGGLEKYGATGKGLLYEYFTPSKIAKKMWALAYKHGFKGGKVLEPSCGIGEFIKYAPEQSLVSGYEINEISAKICKILYPKANIESKYFETFFIKNNNSIRGDIKNLPKFSLVIGNPPYGTMGGKYAGMGEKSYTKSNNYIDYFINRGLDLLEKDGLLIYIIGTEVAAGGTPFLMQQMNEAKKIISQKANLLDAYRLPNGLFDTTDVVTDIIVLQKK